MHGTLRKGHRSSVPSRTRQHNSRSAASRHPPPSPPPEAGESSSIMQQSESADDDKDSALAQDQELDQQGGCLEEYAAQGGSIQPGEGQQSTHDGELQLDDHGDVQQSEQADVTTPTVVEPPVDHDPPRDSHDQVENVRAALVAANILSLGGETEWETRPPGIDPRRVDIPDLRCKCVIQTVDYSSERAEFTVLTNDSLPGFLEKPRPEFAKVRWMHVNGLSWDVIKALALHYNLHPLSLEDMLHSSSSASTRSKVDYFRHHLFASIIVHRTLEPTGGQDVKSAQEETLGITKTTTKTLKNGSKGRGAQLRTQFGFYHHQRDEEAIVDSSTNLPSTMHSSEHYLAGGNANGGDSSGMPASVIPSVDGSGNATPVAAVHPKSYSQYRRNLKEAFKGFRRPKEEGSRTLTHNRSGLSTRWRVRGKTTNKMRKEQAERAAARLTVASLTKDVKVHIHVEQISVFLFRDGTIISFSQDSGYHHQISQIFERIQSRDDLLRDSQDASFVLQALLDVTADDALDIIDEFRDQLTNLESRVLSRPDMDDVRHLHILSSQLLLLKSTLTPLQLLLQALRSQDDAKAAAAFRIENHAPMGTNQPNEPPPASGNISGTPRVGSPVPGGGDRNASQSRRASSTGGGGGVAGMAAFSSGGGGDLGGAPFSEDMRRYSHGHHMAMYPPPPYQQRKGFVSHEAKVYLGDVMDHIDSVLASLDLFSDLAENLIAFTFNNLSYSSNAYMQALAVVSIVFVPATFLSSFYGMNFTTGTFVDDLDQGVHLFWAIALPVSFCTTLLFGYGYLREIFSRLMRDLVRMWHRVALWRSNRRVKDE
ncbi:hypothetical protein C6P46_006474 [Rhodotorula mucilaginosa]|uniref:Uncharacterized protein n=1 Tax=Rhodotorula mucilaginosa TaxID=5537 RepID=A0A9P7B4B0_RHOMI|nr:hypothetical protein C6P46_006474 [Rhodotorula mucilaginosa]